MSTLLCNKIREMNIISNLQTLFTIHFHSLLCDTMLCNLQKFFPFLFGNKCNAKSCVWSGNCFAKSACFFFSPLVYAHGITTKRHNGYMALDNDYNCMRVGEIEKRNDWVNQMRNNFFFFIFFFHFGKW